MNYFVTAIGTDSGKTLASAILVDALQADYYKPIQCGIEQMDYETIESYSNNTYCRIFPSQYVFKLAESPHQASHAEGVNINADSIILPDTENNMIIEGAGGLLVPINQHGETMADIIEKIHCEVILVINFYLGCINHSLLTINELKRRNIVVKGIIFNGHMNPQSEKIILQHSGYRKLLHIDQEEFITNDIIKLYAIKMMGSFYDE